MNGRVEIEARIREWDTLTRSKDGIRLEHALGIRWAQLQEAGTIIKRLLDELDAAQKRAEKAEAILESVRGCLIDNAPTARIRPATHDAAQ